MDRRRLGLMVIAGALLAAVIVPNLVPQQVRGTANMAPIPGPPSVGDCLLESTDGSLQFDNLASGRPTYQALHTAPCTGSRYGEIVHVIPADDVLPMPALAVQDAMSSSDPNAAQCSTALTDYLGLNPDGSAHFQYWSPAAYVGVVLAGPDRLQLSTGQKWIACVASISGPDGQSAKLNRSLKSSFTGAPPPAAAVCVKDPDLRIVTPIDCTVPHQGEIFAWGTTVSGDLDSTCKALVEQFTGMPDPTGAGQLTVYAKVPSVPATVGYSATPVCLVATTSHRDLVGPLLGLGTNPIPWGRP